MLDGRKIVDLLMYFTANFASFIVLYFFCNKVFQRRFAYKDTLIFFAFITSVLLSLTMEFIGPALTTPLILFFIFLYLFIFYKGKVYLKLFIAVLLLSSSSAGEVFAILIISSPLFYFLTPGSFLFNFVGFMISQPLLFLIMYGFSEVLKFQKNQQVSTRLILIFVFVPLISLLFTMASYTVIIENFKNNLVAMLGFCFIILSNVFLCYVFSKVIEGQVARAKLFKVEEKQKFDNMYFEVLEEKYQGTRRFMHDFSGHLMMLNNYCEDKNLEKLKEYLCDLKSFTTSVSTKVCSGNKIIDLILNAKMDVINLHNISLRFDIDDSDLTFIRIMDITTILNNIIDNAIESCKKSDYGFISIKIRRMRNNVLNLIFENTCSCVNNDSQGFVTLKEDKENHGIGLKSIKAVVNKYNGTFSCNYNEQNQTFITFISFEIY